MVVDTSVFVAIALREPEDRRFMDVLEAAPSILVSSVTTVETHLVLSGRGGPTAVRLIDQLIGSLNAGIIPFDSNQADLARLAFQRFGKGRGHPAQLNLGDCCTYALAMQRNLPLLFKGNDFTWTDVGIVAY